MMKSKSMTAVVLKCSAALQSKQSPLIQKHAPSPHQAIVSLSDLAGNRRSHSSVFTPLLHKPKISPQPLRCSDKTQEAVCLMHFAFSITMSRCCGEQIASYIWLDRDQVYVVAHWKMQYKINDLLCSSVKTSKKNECFVFYIWMCKCIKLLMTFL